jgi:hypothetical protein
MSYDFTDHAIVNMIMREHQPTEAGRNVITPGYAFGLEPQCQTCYEPWPCGPITEFREWDKQRQREHFQAMAEGGFTYGPPL